MWFTFTAKLFSCRVAQGRGSDPKCFFLLLLFFFLHIWKNLIKDEKVTFLFHVTSEFNPPPSGYTFSFFCFLNIYIYFRLISQGGRHCFTLGTDGGSAVCLRSSPLRQEWAESGSKKQNGQCRFKKEGNSRKGGVGLGGINSNIKLI